MQLSAPSPAPSESAERPRAAIATALAAATASLLGSFAGSGAAVAQEPADRKWSFDLALHSYQESERVGDYSGNFLVRRAGKNGREFHLLFTIDTLTGASASGAVPAGRAQTFTSPSGKKYYTTPAAEVPLDPTFLDTRVALAANLVRPLGRLSKIDVGVSVSSEWDYLHTGVNGTYTRDFNERRTTFTLGAAFASDTIDPEGGRPLPLAPMLPVGDGRQQGRRQRRQDGHRLLDRDHPCARTPHPRTAQLLGQHRRWLSDRSLQAAERGRSRDGRTRAGPGSARSLSLRGAARLAHQALAVRAVEALARATTWSISPIAT